MNNGDETEWLLFFYSVPATPVNNRVKIWRKLVKIGAVQLKGGAYILPYGEEHHEVLQWLLAELPGLKGEGLLIRTDSVEPLQRQEIIAMFNNQRQLEYQKIITKIDDFSGRIRNLDKGGRDKNTTSLFRQYDKIQAEVQIVQQRDFFQSEFGTSIAARINDLRRQLEELAAVTKNQRSSDPMQLVGRSLRDFSGRTWLTRKRPFVDRMASAWLIRRFIDNRATFAFRDEAELRNLNSGDEISYDVRNGDFTHIDDLCTFEVLLKSFGITEKKLEFLAGIVHDIDIKDGKFAFSETRAIEMILKGIRNRALPDNETLEQGMAVFEALYLAEMEAYSS